MGDIRIIDDRYAAGTCNIGPPEIARRRRSGYAGLAAALVLAVLLLVTDAPPVLRLAVALPLFTGFLGLLQARARFCVGFAVAGVSNFGPLGRTNRVEGPAERRADLRRAAGMAVLAGILAVALAVVFAVLPV